MNTPKVTTTLELREYLPSVCEVKSPVGNILTIVAPNAQYAGNMERGIV